MRRPFAVRLRQRWIVWRLLLRHPKLVYTGTRTWFLTSGPVERHPHHQTIWGAILGLLAAAWAALLFATKSGLVHGIAWACAVTAFYIALSFFAPLPLIPLRDERKVALRRAEREREMKATIAALRNAVRAASYPTEASSDARVLVGYTINQHPNLGIRSILHEVNDRGEVELERGRARRVHWVLQFTSNLARDLPQAHFTILLPDTLVQYIAPIPQGLSYATDHTEERMVSDSGGSLRLRNWLGPIAGRANVTELPFEVDIAFAREIPFRVMVTADDLGNVSYYGRIIGVMKPDVQLVDDLMAEGKSLLSATVARDDEPSAEPGSGDTDGLNAWLGKVRPLIRRYFGTEAHRVSPDVVVDASAATVAAAIERTMPPLINFKKALAK